MHRCFREPLQSHWFPEKAQVCPTLQFSQHLLSTYTWDGEPWALLYWIWDPSCPCQQFHCASLLFPTPTGVKALLLLWLQFFLNRNWRSSYPKISILPSPTQHSPSTPLFTHFPSASRLSCGSLCLEPYSRLHLQPSFSNIPLFCFGCAPVLLPSFCLYLHKRLSLVSFPVLFRLQDNLPSWPFSADSNASLKHTSARLFWNEPSYHRNTSLLPQVLICILITGQFQKNTCS